MAITNPTARGGASVGSLLRDVSERKKQELAAQVAPQAQPTSPLRQLIRTTLLTPQTPGSERIVGVNPEGMQRPSQIVEPPTQAGVAQMGTPGVAAPVGEFVGFPKPTASAGGQGTPAAQAVAPAQAAAAPTATRGASPQVLGASTANYVSPAGPSRLGNPIAAPGVQEVNVQTKGGRNEFGSEQAFQAAQTPVQNLLGGIGKVGTQVTSALNLPQLIPGGIFQYLQDINAPDYVKKALRFFTG